MLEYVFGKLGLEWEQYVDCVDKHKRPNELDYLKGDASRIKALGWAPEYTFETLMDDMISHWMNFYKVDGFLESLNRLPGTWLAQDNIQY